MANQNAQLFNIDLKGELITTQNKNAIRQFEGFRGRNCLIANNSMKKWKKTQTPYIYDDNGNYYQLENDQFKINGITNKSVATGSPFLYKEEITVNYEGLTNVIWAVPYNSDGIDFKAIQTSSNLYLYKKVSNSWILQNTLTGIYKILTAKQCLVFFKIAGTALSVCVIYDGKIIEHTFTITETSDEGINFTIKKDENDVPYFIFRTCKKNEEEFEETCAYETVPTVNFYYMDLVAATDTGMGAINATQFFDGDYIIDIQSIYITKGVIVNYIPAVSRNTPIGENRSFIINVKDITQSIGEGFFKTNFEKGLSSLNFNAKTIFSFNNGQINTNLNTTVFAVPLKTHDTIYSNPENYTQGTPYKCVFVDENSGTYRFRALIPLNFFDFLYWIDTAKICLKNNIFIITYKIKFTTTTEGYAPYINGEGAHGKRGYTSDYIYNTYDDALNAGIDYAENLLETSKIALGVKQEREDNAITITANYFNDKIYLSEDISNYIQNINTSFDLVYNANNLANLSWCGKIFEPWLSIDYTYCSPIWSEFKQGFYYMVNNKWYLVTEKQDIGYIEFIMDRYILLNVKLQAGDIYNLYDTQTKTWYDFACDWDNRVIIGCLINDIITNDIYYRGENSLLPSQLDTVLTSYKSIDIAISSGENVNYLSNVSSAVFQPIIKNIFNINWNSDVISNTDIINKLIHLDFKTGYEHQVELYFSTTLNGNTALESAPPYIANYDNTSIVISPLLQGYNYPLATDSNIIFNAPLTASYISTVFSVYYLCINNIYYQLNIKNDNILFAYNYGTGLANITEMFALQGNTYIIRNNIISSCTISDNIIQNVQAVISCKGLIFLGTNVTTAFFYSPANKKILGFTGSRDFIDLAEFTDIETIYTYAYSITFKAFFIVSNIGCICITDEGYVSIIKDDVYNNIILYSKGVGLHKASSGQWDIISLYDAGSPVPVKTSTAFYGFGNNRVGIIDTWYLKLYAEEAYTGNLKLKVVSITNKGTESEETTLTVTKDMFDPITHYYYLRYQPKLQRGIGVSLEIESDYDIIELSCSAIADTTVQLSKPFNKQNVINGGKI